MSHDEILGLISEQGIWHWPQRSGWFAVKRGRATVVVCVQSSGCGVALARSEKEGEQLIEQVVHQNKVHTPVRIKVIGESQNNKAIIQAARDRGIAIEVSRDVAPGSAETVYLSVADGILRLSRHESDKIPVTKMPNLRAKTRVLIVDDSKTMRQVLRMIFSRDPAIEVVGECENALNVEQELGRLKPDVISLDLNMPGMDGLTLLRTMIPRRPIPVILVTALGIEQGDQVLQALAAGAVDYIQKPALSDIEAVADDICARIKAAAKANVRISREATKVHPGCDIKLAGRSNGKLIAIGSSTGGTEALKEIFQGLPANIPPIVVVQHIPAVFSAAFASRLASLLPFAVAEAKDGDAVVPGKVLIAPGGFHMTLAKQGSNFVVRIEAGDPIQGHKPSVDALFDSVAKLAGRNAIGVILTGMGKDGAAGLLKMRDAGSPTVGQDEATSVVYGMPRVAKQLGAVQRELPLHKISDYLLELLSQSEDSSQLRATGTQPR